MTTALSHGTDAADPQAVLTAMAEQRNAYRALAGLVERQASLVSDGLTDALLNLLGDRQRLTQRIEALNERTAPARQDWQAFSDALNDTDRQHAEAIVREVQSLLQSIMERDQADQQSMRAARDRVGNALKQVNRTAAATRAYGGNKPNPTVTPTATEASRFAKFNQSAKLAKYADRSA